MFLLMRCLAKTNSTSRQYTGKYNQVHAIFSMLYLSYRISEIIGWRMFRPYITDFIFQFLPVARTFRKHLNVLHSFTNKVIAERKQLRCKTKKDPKMNMVHRKKCMSFLDLLLQYSEDDASLTDRELREEVDTFMFEVLTLRVEILRTAFYSFLGP